MARLSAAMVLRYFADLPETQIASVTGISEASVRSHAAQALSSLRAELDGTGDDEHVIAPPETRPRP